MSSIRLIYILLHIFEIWMLFIAGKKMSRTKTDRGYWKASLWAFVPYVMVLGLRFGHNIDWNHYSRRYNEMTTMDWSTTEPIYNFIFYILNTNGIPYFIFISLQAVFFMFSFLLLAKHFRKCLYFVLPLLPVVAQSNDNYIRWYWAVSFVLIGFYILLSGKKNKLFKCVLLFVCGFAVHNGSIVLFMLIPAYYWLQNRYLPPLVSTIAVFISIFFLTIAVVKPLSDLATSLYLFGGDLMDEAKVASYLLKINDITEGGLTDATGIISRSIRDKIIIFISFFPVIWYGPKYLKQYKYGILYYNLFIIGAFLNPFFSTVEIFDRYSKMLLIFQAIVAGIVYYVILKDRAISQNLKLLCVLSMLCCFYPFARYTFLVKQEYRMMYIWDANGREYVNPDLYINDMLRRK